MAKKYFRNIALFFIIWVIVMIIYSISGKVTDLEYLWKFFLLPALFLSTLAAIATTLELLFKVRKGINWIFLAAAVAGDQAIKTYLFSMDWESHLHSPYRTCFLHRTHPQHPGFLSLGTAWIKAGMPPAQHHSVHL